MIRVTVLALLAALLIHAAVLLFGGLLLFHEKPKETTEREVELLSEEAKPEKKPEEREKAKEAAKAAEQADERVAEQQDAPPDMRELSSLEAPAGPALENLSLSDLEGVLGGETAGGSFAQSFTLGSGGRIGASGVGGQEDFDPVLAAGDLDQRPRPLFQAAPVYPFELRRKRVEGNVRVVFVVDTEGRVTNPKVESATDPAFEKPALDAVRQWRFEAGSKDGKKVQFKMRIPITFKVT